MTFKTEIEYQLQTHFDPAYLEVTDESHQHHTHGKPETHFKVVLVSAHFLDLSRVKRHQAIYACLASTMPHIHALALHVFTPSEWETGQHDSLLSPQCRGGFDAH
jgi:BolA protein